MILAEADTLFKVTIYFQRSLRFHYLEQNFGFSNFVKCKDLMKGAQRKLRDTQN